MNGLYNMNGLYLLFVFCFAVILFFSAFYLFLLWEASSKCKKCGQAKRYCCCSKITQKKPHKEEQKIQTETEKAISKLLETEEGRISLSQALVKSLRKKNGKNKNNKTDS